MLIFAVVCVLRTGVDFVDRMGILIVTQPGTSLRYFLLASSLARVAMRRVRANVKEIAAGGGRAGMLAVRDCKAQRRRLIEIRFRV